MGRTGILRGGTATLLLVGAALVVSLLAATVEAALVHPLPGVTLLLVLIGGAAALASILVTLGSAARQVAAHRAAARRVRVLEIAPGVVRDPVPRAFCVGLLRPRVVVTTGARERLTAAELAAVLAHEQRHVARRDGLVLLVVRALADGLFFCPGAAQLADRAAALAEVHADEAAEPRALAAAMLRLDGISDERVDRLLGHPLRWHIGGPRMAGGAVVVGALAVGSIVLAELAGCTYHPLALDTWGLR